MTAYTVRHGYASRRDGRAFGPWSVGERVDLDEVDAVWVERDSPGVLVLLDDELVDERGPLTEEVEAEAYREHEKLTAPAPAQPAQQRRRRGGGA